MTTAERITSFTQMPNEDLDALAVHLRMSVQSHPDPATCLCPAAEAVRWLLDHGYEIRRVPSEPCICGADSSPDGYRMDVVCPKHDGVAVA